MCDQALRLARLGANNRPDCHAILHLVPPSFLCAQDISRIAWWC